MFINVNNKKVYFLQNGKGKAILFLHGWGGSSNSLEQLFKQCSNNYQSIILDLPGFGQSDLPESTWGIGEYAELITDFLEKLEVKQINVFGHSFGGALAIYLAANNPHLVRKLMLCAPSCKREKNLYKSKDIFKKIPRPIKKIIYKILYPNSDLFKYQKLESNFRKIVTQDLTPLITKVKQPTLILWGNIDKETPIYLANELKEKIAHAQLKTFADIGHNLPLLKPELIYNEIAKFI